MVMDRQTVMRLRWPSDVRRPRAAAALTQAEQRVAEQVAEGLSNKEISAVLGRSQATIKHQLASAMRKLGTQSRCQLIVLLLTGRRPRIF